jgi:hypothetical protein
MKTDKIRLISADRWLMYAIVPVRKIIICKGKGLRKWETIIGVATTFHQN